MTRTSDLRRLHDSVAASLGTRRLVYYGIRGSDAIALAEFEQLAAVVSVTDAFEEVAGVEATTAEQVAGVRVDLDAEVRLPPRADAAVTQALAEALEGATVLVPYRPTALVSDAVLKAGRACTYLGLFHEQQAAFEFKPWVDREISALDVPSLGWRLVGPADRSHVADLLEGGPVVARISVSSGGAGMSRIDTIEDYDAFSSLTGAASISISRFQAATIPLNIGGVVWSEGVTLHPLSLQLIGIDSLVDRQFGYCGNDFAAARTLPAEIFRLAEEYTTRIGVWLARLGYRGAFGVDYLATQSSLLFCELNPRFQGSSRVSDLASQAVARPGLALEHVASFLELPMPIVRQPLADLAADIPPLAHAVVHRLGPDARLDVPSALQASNAHRVMQAAEVVCPPNLTCARNAVQFRAVFGSRITDSGYNLVYGARRAIDAISVHLAQDDKPAR